MEMRGFWDKYKTSKLFWGLCSGALLLLVAAVVVICLRSVRDVQMKAIGATEEGVAPDGAFAITVNGTTTAEELREQITVEPAFSFDLTGEQGDTFTLQPFQPLFAGENYTITALGKKFAFHVRNALVLRSVFPADNGQKVPTSTGIELEFNSSDIDLERYRQAFSIEPAVEGDFSAGDRRFVFYPQGALEPNTRYTVTVDTSLESKSGAKLEQPVTFSFVTASQEDEETRYLFQLSGNGVSMNSLTSETPLVPVYIEESVPQSERKVQVTVYDFGGFKAYREQLLQNVRQPRYKYVTTTIDTEGLQQRASFEVQPIDSAQGQENNYRYAGRKLLQFPEALPEGWYAVEFELTTGGNTLKRQMFLQVSDLSVFYMMNGETLLGWVNDASTGNPVEGAVIEITGAFRAKGQTAADGTVMIENGLFTTDTPSEAGGGAVTVTSEEHTFVDVGYFYSYDEPAALDAHKYMSYLFTDRPIYHTSDSIMVWGTVMPRSPETPAPETVTIELEGGVASVELPLQSDGTFTGELKFENMQQNYWASLELKAGETTLRTEYLRVEDFVKPIYTATTATEQMVYAAYETGQAVINFDVSLYDGTPASSFSAQASTWSSGLELSGAQVVTDEQGHASVTARFTESPNTWYPQSYRYQFSNSDAESENFYRYGNVYAVHRDVQLLAETVKAEGGGRDVQISTYQVDLSRVDGEEDLWNVETLRGAPISRTVTAEIHKVYYTRETLGWYYDFVSRESRESYDYKEHDDVVETRTVTTGADGMAVLTGLPQSDNDNCYYVVLRTPDTGERTVETTAYLGMLYERGQNDGIHQYVLNKVVDPNAADLNDLGGDEATWRLNQIRSQFMDEEAVTFQLEDNTAAVAGFTGRILYSVVQDGFSRTAVISDARFTLPFEEGLLPNYVITGAYFDGKHVYALDNKYMYFDPKQRELEVELTADRESYHPADTATVTATVKQKATGQPVKNASVVLAVVDEAIFAIKEQQIDILDSLYESVYHPNLIKYTSYLQNEYGGGGEKGGGGGEADVRTDFKDTAWFQVLKTDGDGRAKCQFKLPDNITEWRMTSLALTPQGQAGSVTTKVKATQEYFVLPIVNETILEGDTFAVMLRSAGVAIGDNDPVRYTVRVQGGGIDKVVEASSTAKGYGVATFENLDRGEYTMTITGSCGQYSDSVRLPFSVIGSGVEVSLVKTVELKNGISIEPLRYPVNVAVYDRTQQFRSRILNHLLCSGYGNRTDLRIARTYAAREFERQGAQWYDEEALQQSFSDVMNQSGAISLFPYSEYDIEYTAKAYLAAPELFPPERIRGSITPADVDAMSGAKSAFYLLQASVGGELPDDLAQRIDSDTTLDYVDKMYLAATLAVSDDQKAALTCYNSLVRPNLETLTGISGEIAYRVRDSVDPSRSQHDCTAAASLLASVLNTEEAKGLANALLEKQSFYETYPLELMIYLTRVQPEKGTNAKFSYVMGGKTITEELKEGICYLSFSKTQLATANFKVLSGDVWADVYYTGAPDQTADQSRKTIGLTKTIEPVEGDFSRGKLVKITLTPDLSVFDQDLGSTELVIDDYIPSGMRFERYHYEDAVQGNSWYLASRQGQRLRFSAWGDHGALTPIIYYARCAAPGDYVVESAYISSASSDLWGATDRAEVKLS